MAGAALAIEVKIDDREVRAALKKLERAGGDLAPVFADIGEYLLISHHQRWEREQGPDGKPWEPLADSTLRRKMLKGVRRGKGKRRKRLTTGHGTRTGAIRALAASRILVESGDLSGLLRYQATGEGLEFGTDRIYGATHQFGDPERNIPARPFLGLSNADKTEIMAILRRHLTAAMV